MGGVSRAQVEFERVFREHHATVYRYAVRRIEQAAVQDVVAETFLTAWRRFDQLDGDPLTASAATVRSCSTKSRSTRTNTDSASCVTPMGTRRDDRRANLASGGVLERRLCSGMAEDEALAALVHPRRPLLRGARERCGGGELPGEHVA